MKYRVEYQIYTGSYIDIIIQMKNRYLLLFHPKKK
jgi:hypothetical protein